MSRSHRIYINRAHVFDAGVKWTTVAGLYPHAYVPEEEYAATVARAERAEAALAIAEEALRKIDVGEGWAAQIAHAAITAFNKTHKGDKNEQA